MEKIDGLSLAWESHATGEVTGIKPPNEDANQLLGSVHKEPYREIFWAGEIGTVFFLFLDNFVFQYSVSF